MRSLWLVHSKLSPPRRFAPTVARVGKLLGLLEPTAAQIVLLQAPAGYGKSTLLSEVRAAFVERTGGFTPWLSLDETMANDVSLFAYLAVALRMEGVELPQLDSMAEDDLLALPANVLVQTIEAALDRSVRPVGVFLDDLHALGNAARDSAISRFLSRLPASARAFVSLRGEGGALGAHLGLQRGRAVVRSPVARRA